MPKVKPRKLTCCVGVDVDSSAIDAAIEKANRLVELLREASSIIDSLFGKLGSEP